MHFIISCLAEYLTYGEIRLLIGLLSVECITGVSCRLGYISRHKILFGFRTFDTFRCHDVFIFCLF